MSSSESSLPEACWAAFVMALLEQDRTLEADEDGAVAAGAPEAEDVLVEEAEETVGTAVEEPAPDPDTEAKENSPMGKGAEESFLSDSTVPMMHMNATPGTTDADHSFQTEGLSRAVIHGSFLEDDSLMQTPPLIRDGRLHTPGSGSTSFTSVPAADLARQHFEWAQELESVDQKQADLMMTQWKLIRSQTGMLAQQLVELRKELDFVKHEQRQTSQLMEQQCRESKDVQQRLGATLQQSVQETHMSLARMRTEVQKRPSKESDAQKRLQSLETWAAPAVRKLECEVAELRSATDVSVKQVCQLKDQLLQQIDEWKAGHAVVMEHSTKWQDRVRKGLRALMNAHESHRSEVQEIQQSLQESFEQKLHTKFAEVQRRMDECSTQKDSHQDIENRLNDFEAMLDTTLEGHSKGMERKLSDVESRFQDLENSDKLLKVSLNQEIAARHSMVEVLDQMLKTETSRIATSVSEQVAVSHLDWKESQKAMLEHLSKETTDRQEQARAINADLQSLAGGLGERVSRLEGGWHSVRQDWREAKGNVRALQGQLQELEASLDAGLQGLRSELQSCLREERLKREVNGTGMAEQIQAWEDFHKHLRQFYMSHTTLPAGDTRHSEPDMTMERLAELLRCSQESETSHADVPEILRSSRLSDL
ncbi:APUM5 [Symbiodinium sp. CCMP2592]|nr:APUM5 [Symbiodinium sp. CCMP2592]